MGNSYNLDGGCEIVSQFLRYTVFRGPVRVRSFLKPLYSCHMLTLIRRTGLDSTPVFIISWVSLLLKSQAVMSLGQCVSAYELIGSWYTPREIGKRAMIFWLAGSIGRLFSGFLQSAAYTNLDGVNGYSGCECQSIVEREIQWS